ncbi:hypothetical protein HFN01_19340 [Rhizobium leguminosarum]|uniref:hypothetical protein n=1 Tax=Rhizobium leguminosarum TaxID=384 RepID=UPI001C987582|nr:hypothetical protein [Rhizobium leguminosarum]MBY5396966.1 hypothetical protein [Rhizobium leguminosarum]
MNPAIEYLEQRRHFLQAIHWVDEHRRPVSEAEDRFTSEFLDHATDRPGFFYSTMRGEMHQRSLENLLLLGFSTEEIQAAIIAWEVNRMFIESEKALLWRINEGVPWQPSDCEAICFSDQFGAETDVIDRLATPVLYRVESTGELFIGKSIGETGLGILSPSEVLRLGFATVEYQRAIGVEVEFGIKPMNEAELLYLVINNNYTLRGVGYVSRIEQDPSFHDNIFESDLKV